MVSNISFQCDLTFETFNRLDVDDLDMSILQYRCTRISSLNILNWSLKCCFSIALDQRIF